MRLCGTERRKALDSRPGSKTHVQGRRKQFWLSDFWCHAQLSWFPSQGLHIGIISSFIGYSVTYSPLRSMLLQQWQRGFRSFASQCTSSNTGENKNIHSSQSIRCGMLRFHLCLISRKRSANRVDSIDPLKLSIL